MYRYYTCLHDKEKIVTTCPIKAVPAGEIEGFVLDQMTPILKAPEVITEVGKQTGLKLKQVTDIFENDFLSMLTPIEKKRLVQILVERVTINEDTINIEFRTENIKSIQEVYCEQNP